MTSEYIVCTRRFRQFNPLNAELNPTCHLLALLGAHRILHVSKIRVKFHTALLVLHNNKFLKNIRLKFSFHSSVGIHNN